MLGLLTLGLTSIMIYTLVKNALLGKQLSADDKYNGSVELIIPVTPKTEFFLEAWQKSVSSFQLVSGQLKVHILIDGHHPSLNAWQELRSKIPYLEIHSFPMRPVHVEPIPWMLDQMAPKITAQVVIIGDAELVPTESAFLSIAKNVTEKERSYFVVPQTAKFNVLGEAISVLNPTLAFASFFGFRKWRRNLTHPLLSISQGWMAMTLKTFKELDFKNVRISTWKEAISRQWDEQGKNYHLAFGEKHLLRFYPEDVKTLTYQLKERWEDLWSKRDKVGFWLYLVALFLWSFPVICLLTHPFWSIVSLFLLLLYRFFSKIVFQESWRSILLHPVACLFWLGTFVWWLSDKLKEKYLNRQQRGIS
jgi:hypothetical protein